MRPICPRCGSRAIEQYEDGTLYCYRCGFKGKPFREVK